MPPVALAVSPAPGPIPDLLSADAAVRVDLAELHQTLAFGFAIGTTPESFDTALANATLPPSAWDRASFAARSLPRSVVTRCLAIRIGGRSYAASIPYLLRVVGEPPRDDATRAFRRAVLEELAEKAAPGRFRADLRRDRPRSARSSAPRARRRSRSAGSRS